MAEPAHLDLPWTGARAASRLPEFLIRGVLGPLMDLVVVGNEHHGAGEVVQTLAPGHAARVEISDGGSLLIFTEGTRSRDGRVGRLRTRAALLAAEHHLPIVPIYASGTREALPRGHRWMVFRAGWPGPRHPLEIRFGKPIGQRARERPSEVMERVRLFLAECAAETEREPKAGHAHRRLPA
jgi:1-acyl-sn-glycerol-3-phosphate acyltransferase